MDFRLIWSPEAVEDLESIVDYISRDSEFYAKAIISKIINEVKIIPHYPQIGRKVPEINDEVIRELIVYNYRVVYHIKKNIIQIVSIIHSRSDIKF